MYSVLYEWTTKCKDDSNNSENLLYVINWRSYAGKLRIQGNIIVSLWYSSFIIAIIADAHISTLLSKEPSAVVIMEYIIA